MAETQTVSNADIISWEGQNAPSQESYSKFQGQKPIAAEMSNSLQEAHTMLGTWNFLNYKRPGGICIEVYDIIAKSVFNLVSPSTLNGAFVTRFKKTFQVGSCANWISASPWNEALLMTANASLLQRRSAEAIVKDTVPAQLGEPSDLIEKKTEIM